MDQILVCTLVGTDKLTVLVNKRPSEEVRRFAYLPFGHLNVEDGRRTKLLFNGQHLESLLHCYFLGNGYRAFNTELMRFMSPDSLSPFSMGGLNGYAYCRNDPINRHDPSGHVDSLKLRYMAETKITRRGLKRFDTNRATQEFSGFWRKKEATVDDFVMAHKLGRRLDRLHFLDRVYKYEIEAGRKSLLEGLEHEYNKVKGKVDRTRQRLSYLRYLYEPITFTVLTPRLDRREFGTRPAVEGASSHEDAAIEQTSRDRLDPSPAYVPPPAYSDMFAPLGENKGIRSGEDQ
jgi:RHS repeat-associated protein